ncbi:hypothetical protein ACV56Z_10990 [Staphylococcus aureus]
MVKQLQNEKSCYGNSSASSYDLENKYANNAVFVDCVEDLYQTPTIAANAI